MCLNKFCCYFFFIIPKNKIAKSIKFVVVEFMVINLTRSFIKQLFKFVKKKKKLKKVAKNYAFPESL